MSNTTLLAGAVFSFLAAGVYGYIGNRLAYRPVGENSRLAWHLFTIWWAGIALVTAMGGAQSLLAAGNILNLPLFLALNHFNLLILCVILWSLLFYLLYLFTGNKTHLVPLSVFYVFYYLLLLYFIFASGAPRIEKGDWQVRVVYEHPPEGLLYVAVLLLLLLPQLVGALAYFSLLPKAENATQKYRITLVSTAILVWFGVPLVAAASRISQDPYWQLASRFVGLLAALTILMAYVPPQWIRQRWNIEPIPTRPRPA